VDRSRGTDGRIKYKVWAVLAPDVLVLGLMDATVINTQRIARYCETSVGLNGREAPAGWYVGPQSSCDPIAFPEVKE
jgi:hypothetical protein